MSTMFDLAVTGGGPAGTSAAITAARLGLNVVLLEAGKFPRHKVCGEFVSGEALELLGSLLGSNELLATAPRISQARVFIDGRAIEFPIEPAAASISRIDLDFALWQAALGCGVEARSESRVHACNRHGEYFLLLTPKGELKARVVINATGRWSNLTAHRSEMGERWIGVKGHFAEAAKVTSCDLYFFAGGYCGVQPLGSNLVNAAAMVRVDVARTLDEVLHQNKELALRSSSWRLAAEPVSTSPLIFRPPRTAENFMALCGDAAAFLDPFAGDGISMALHSGRIAATELAAYVKRECSLESALQAYDRAYRERLQPVLKNGARLRRLIQLPRLGRLAAITLLKFPALARFAVEQTRARGDLAT